MDLIRKAKPLAQDRLRLASMRLFSNDGDSLMKQMAIKSRLAMMLALILGFSGCSRQSEPIGGDNLTPERQAIPVTEKGEGQAENGKHVLTPAEMGFPPEQPAPWAITVSPEPLSPVTTANTGDFRGSWPEYFAPREIRITAPELPPGIVGPTLSTAEAPLSPSR